MRFYRISFSSSCSITEIKHCCYYEYLYSVIILHCDIKKWATYRERLWGMLATLLIVLKHILCFLLLAIFEINGLCYLACTRLFLEGGGGAFPIGLTGSSYSYMLSRLLQINNILLLPASYYIHTCMHEWAATSISEELTSTTGSRGRGLNCRPISPWASILPPSCPASL